jgi:hypothetical protein
MLPSWIDPLIHILELLVVAGAVGYLRKITRLVDLFEEYPPHRHEPGRVLYPKHYSPGRAEDLT